MYNRYVPASDGTMKRQVVREPESPKPAPVRQSGGTDGLTNLLSGLLPPNLDNTDILIAVLLMLMSADKESQNNALLTLAFYLFM